ncbi:related to Pre-rRNA-processing protein TSR2 [Saccharomycodes ludwigii]|uniref:Related to Pre-rRNA-processing protein TSR2 n=1 Tax=Saccharomycodes ludwigii TaxID=36035 RepID=A0A376B4U4_9ASCO|nr:related to Pre-rRNA-processing protein TSR2 [Saccharomycodes ludwigii]
MSTSHSNTNNNVAIDVTDYVEAIKPHTNLQFTDEKQQARFELGVSMMIYKWDALDVAVENQWGGVDSAEKRDWITSIIVDLFKDNKIVDVQLIEETLFYAMVDEFETQIEDDSALPISMGIIGIWRQCAAHDYSIVEQLYLQWKNKQENRQQNINSRRVQVGNDPLNPDVSDEEEEEEQNDYDDMDIDEPPSLVQPKPDMPIVDDDGFELVQKKGKRRN